MLTSWFQTFFYNNNKNDIDITTTNNNESGIYIYVNIFCNDWYIGESNDLIRREKEHPNFFPGLFNSFLKTFKIFVQLNTFDTAL